jgi:LacI family transcriptional regulator
MQKTTITNIAIELGITPSTVSRALNGSPRVKEETRVAIEKKAAELGYERNIMASNLRKGVANLVGIIVPRINRQFFSNVISGAESVLGNSGFNVLICQTHEKLEDEIKALKTLRSNQVAGIIMSHSIESMNGKHIMKIIDGKIKLVQFDRVFSDLPGARVVNNNFSGAYEATKHLIDNGYKKIGTLAGYMNSEAYKERLEGYKKALKDAGMKVDENIIFYKTIIRETGYESGKKAIEAGCDALYSAGDFSALGAIDAAKEAGLNVPEEFGIVGTANENFTELMSPTMSSLDLDPYEMGRRAAQSFLVLVKTDLSLNEVTVPMSLKIRQSSVKSNKK